MLSGSGLLHKNPFAHSAKAGIATVVLAVAALGFAAPAWAKLKLNDEGYFATPGLNVIVFSDIYPEGHQTGVTIVQHGVRVAANGASGSGSWYGMQADYNLWQAKRRFRAKVRPITDARHA